MADSRVSSYEIILSLPESTEKVLAVNGLYGAFDLVFGKDAEILQKAVKDRQYLKFLSASCFKRLSERGHIVTETEVEERENVGILSGLYRSLRYRNVIHPVIVPGSSCNFRCRYCYERNTGSGACGNGHASVMSKEQAKAVFRQLENLKKSGYRIDRCTLFGGEPLMEQNRNILEMTEEFCRRWGIRADCVTNGYYADCFMDLLCGGAFRALQITVDGTKEVHDSRRICADGSGSFEKIMGNIALALGNGLQVTVRINVNRENLNTAADLLPEFENRGFTGYSGFSCYFKPTLDRYEDREENAVTEQELYTVLCEKFGPEEAVRLSRSYGIVEKQLEQCMEGTAYPELHPAACGAAIDMVVIDPDGRLHACLEMTGRDEKTGTSVINADVFSFEKKHYYWKTRTVEHMEECSVCPYLMFCGGGCAAAAMDRSGSLFAEDCRETKSIFETAARIVSQRMYQKNECLSQGLSMYDLFRELTPEDRTVLKEETDPERLWKTVGKYLTKTKRAFE